MSEKNIAIVGCSYRFPGDIDNAQSLWEALSGGKDLVSEIPAERWPTDVFQHPRRKEPGRSITFAAGVLSRIDEFDAAFFGISPREASLLDPQQRLLLELAWEAMEDAGIPSARLAGSDCAVYVGISGLDYGVRGVDDLAGFSAYSMTGNTLSIAANRLSYVFDLHGPSLAIDTACSSSLVALHHACNALHAGEASVAMVGGVNMLLHPYPFIGFTKASMLSGGGRCRAFDAAGDGYVRSEGAAVFLLKPLAQAVADGDRIHAVIRASGVNADGGRKTGLTIPSIDGQVELMRSVLQRSGLAAAEVDYLEAHGTGTAVGDPIETAAIAAVYGAAREGSDPLPIGSIKTNLGHLEPASGMAGLAKALLVLKHRQVPPSIHLDTPNPRIDFTNWKLHPVTEILSLAERAGERPLRVGINSFGFGGANAHVLLESPAEVEQGPAVMVPRLPPLVISARSEAALRAQAANYARRLADLDHAAVYDVAYGAAYRRDRLGFRLIVQTGDRDDLLAALNEYAASGKETRGLVVETVPNEVGKLAFIYAGNGSQWLGMGQMLLAESPRFAALIDALEAPLLEQAGFSLRAVLTAVDQTRSMDDTAVAQPALFAIQYALTVMLRESGIVPDMVTGHSVGEVAAAWCSGALTLDQAVQVICVRSAAQARTRGAGRMAVAAMSEASMSALLVEHGLDALEIAGINSPQNVTLSGPLEQLEQLAVLTRARGVASRLLDLDYAFHSQAMDPVAGQLAEALAGLDAPAQRKLGFVSTVTGQLSEDPLDAQYWWDNVRRPVRFASAIEVMAEAGCRVFVEIGPHAILQRYLNECLGSRQLPVRILHSLRKHDDGIDRVETLVSRLHLHAHRDTLAAHFPARGRFVELPNYPWQRERYWQKPGNESLRLIERWRVHPLLGWPLTDAVASWENVLDPQTQPWLNDHRVGGAVVLPGAAYVEMALAASRLHYGGESVEIEQLDIVNPLVFDGEHGRNIRLELNVRDGSFQIRSRERLDDGEWSLHAAGRLLGEVAAFFPPAMPELLRDNCASLDHETHYRLAGRLGLDYGPAFRGMARASFDTNILDGEFLGDEPEDSEWLLNPARLDVCFQSLLDFFQREIEAGFGLPLLPVKIGHLHFLGHAQAATRFRTRIRRRSLRSVLADFALLNDSGECVAVLADCRFRAASLRKDTKTAAACWEVVPHLQPGRSAASSSAMPAVGELAGYLRKALTEDGEAERRAAYFDEAQPLLEALVTAFAAEAVTALLAQDQALSLSGDDAGVSDAQRQLITWVRDLLLEQGLLEQTESGLRTISGDLPPAAVIWRTLQAEYPDTLQELLLVGCFGKQLPAMLRGQCDPLEHRQQLQCSHPFETLFDDSLAYRGSRLACERLILDLRRDMPANRRLRVLEISAGVSTIPLRIAEAAERAPIDYCVASFQTAVCDKLAHEYRNRSWVDVVEIDPATLEFQNRAARDEPLAAEHFDLILVRHVAGTTSNSWALLKAVQARLASGAILAIVERAEDLAARAIFAPARLPPASAWEKALADLGLLTVETVIEPAAGDSRVGNYFVLARQPETAVAVPEVSKHWLLLVSDAGDQPLADAVGRRLLAAGQFVHGPQTLPTDTHAIPAFLDEQRTLAGEAFEQVIWIAPLAAADDTRANTSLLGLVQALATGSAAIGLQILTRGGAPVDGLLAAGQCRPDQTALWGLARVAMNECPGLGPRLIDLPDLGGASPLAMLVEELLEGAAGSRESEVLLMPDARHVLRMRPARIAIPSAGPGHEARYRLDFRVPGRLRNLLWLEQPPRDPGPDEIEVKPLATGLNFRDVMYVMGLLPDEAVENGFAGASLGLEFSGVVTRVGSAVTQYAPGDAVMGFGSACFASHVVTRASAVTAKPEAWSFESAATVPTTFFTVYYALRHLANLQPGERVLIHGAAGGVGIAAIQLARHLGAEVFATAGSDEKRLFVELLGADHVLDSRSLAFADQILALTGNEGVDVVLNPLAGEAIRRNLRILRPFGRFLELGKRDFFENTPVGLRPFKDNISYFGIDADQLLIARPDLADRLFREVMALFAEGVLIPLPYRAFAAEQVVDAFRYMQQARQIGKVVVGFANARIKPQALLPQDTAIRFKAQASYLVTGGISGFGLETARWLAIHGAGHVILAGRRGSDTPGAEAARAALEALGASVDIVACDVARAESLQALLAAIPADKPLKGVFHAAMVIDDALIGNLDAARMHAVLDPKIKGGWQLHEQTRELALDHFMLYSSVTTSIGNPGQASYVAANAWLEGLAVLRRALGLPVTCIGWGPIGDAGYLTRNQAVRDGLSSRLGADPLSAAQAMQALGQALAAPQGNIAIADFHWPTLSRMLPSASLGRFSPLRRYADEQVASADSLEDFRALIDGKSPEEIQHIVTRLVTQEVAQVLAISPERIDPSRPLHDLGLDSLMGVELALGLEKRFAIQIPAMMLNEGPTVARVTSRIMERLLTSDDADGDQNLTQVAMHLAERHGESVSQEKVESAIQEMERKDRMHGQK